MGSDRVVAGVDIGTLTCRLLIARVSGLLSVPDPTGHPQKPPDLTHLTDLTSLTALHADRRILRLGEGVGRTGRLAPAAMSRVLETLQTWRRLIASYRVDGEIVVATSAVREAENREEFVARVEAEAGFVVEILDGEEEARRTMLGIRVGLQHHGSPVLAIDIGGGSTEFILDRPGTDARVRTTDLGVVRLSEAILDHHPPDDGRYTKAKALIRERTESVRADLGDLTGIRLVGTAGTITTLAAMAQGLRTYDRAKIHNLRLPLATVRDLERALLSRSLEEVARMPGLEPGREGVIVAGTVILKGIMETLDLDECLVSDFGLREGIVVDLARRLDASR